MKIIKAEKEHSVHISFGTISLLWPTEFTATDSPFVKTRKYCDSNRYSKQTRDRWGNSAAAGYHLSRGEEGVRVRLPPRA